MLTIEHDGQRLGVKEWAARLRMYVQALHIGLVAAGN
jgi:hypothetical protein